MENISEEKHSKKFLKILLKITIVVIFLVGVAFALKVAPNYVRNDITDRTNLIINYSNVTGRMKHNLIVDENGIVYLSLDDIKNYYDRNIYYDEEYNQIVTSTEGKLAVIKLNENKIKINGVESDINGAAMVKDGVYYLPISEMEEVYKIKITNPENKVVMESLDRKLTTATTNKKVAVKSKTIFFSSTIEKIEENEKVVITEMEPNTLPEGWIKIRTQNGNLGYVEEKNLNNIHVERETTVYEAPMKEKVSMVWEYFSEYGKAPNNENIKYNGVNVVSPSFFYLKLKDTEKDNLTKSDVQEQSKVIENVGDEGVKYIEWAHKNGYKVWAKLSNETKSTTIDEFSCIINDYELRNAMITDILNYVKKYNLDGINVDFEYMYKNDKDAFSKFIIELAPQLKANGTCLSVDVTAPNGGDNWSLCYDRNLIGEIADYIVFMGYDQYGTSVIGTTSGYNWLVNSIKNFREYEEVPSEKLILGLPFYTKLWQTKDGNTIKSSIVSISGVAGAVPSGASREWQEDVQQYYVQYEKGGYVYKMWIEDEESFAKKIGLVKDKNLAGAAYWKKGFDTDGIWEVIKKGLDL